MKTNNKTVLEELSSLDKQFHDRITNEANTIIESLSSMNTSTKSKMLEIGKSALLIKKELKERSFEFSIKLSLSKCYEELFKKDIRRVNDCIAYYKAIEHGSNLELPCSINIILGQALSSRNQIKAQKANDLISKNLASQPIQETPLLLTDIRRQLNQSSEQLKPLPPKRIFNTLERLNQEICFYIENVDENSIDDEKLKSVINKLLAQLEKLKLMTSHIPLNGKELNYES